MEYIDYDKEVSLKEIVKAKNNYALDYIRLIPDTDKCGKLYIIRKITTNTEKNQEVRLMTVLEGVIYRFHGDKPEVIHLHSSNAQNVLTWLNCLKWEKTETDIYLTYYEDNGKGLTKNNSITEETLNLRYRKESNGQEKRIKIDNIYKTPIQKIGRT